MVLRKIALATLTKNHSRHPHVLKQRFIAGLSACFQFQRHVLQKGVHATWNPRVGETDDTPRSYFGR